MSIAWDDAAGLNHEDSYYNVMGVDTNFLTTNGTMFTTGNVLLGSTLVNNEPHHYVTKGQQYKVEFTLDNNGSTTHSSMPVNYDLSTDATITTGDTLLTTSTQTVSPDTPLTVRQTITIPASLTSSTNYWVGAIIDPSNTVTEFNEANNASYVGIRVL